MEDNENAKIKSVYVRSETGGHYKDIGFAKDPDGVILSGNVLKTAAVVFAILSTIITAVFAFTQKADRSEIVKLQKQVEDQRVELTTVKAQSSIALQTIKEIRDDFKELRRDIKEIRKALRGIK